MSAVKPPTGDGDGAVAADYEETHVHGVYEAIAPHFSATRHKPWPFVSSFLAAQPPGSVGLDVGCGNGKNMGVNRDVLVLGCDRSAALVALARDLWCSEHYHHDVPGARDEDGRQPVVVPVGGGGIIPGADVAVADSLELPFRQGSADFVICIAVIHHLSTRERRVDAIRQLLRCLVRPAEAAGTARSQQRSGKILVYVWALEQSSSRRGWDEGGEQDLLVPWVMKKPQQKKQKSTPKPRKQKKQQGEPDETTTTGQGEEEAAAGPSEADACREGAAGKESGDNAGGRQHTDRTFHRFYHLYRKGELEEDVVAAGGEVLSSGYERDNWWIIAG